MITRITRLTAKSCWMALLLITLELPASAQSLQLVSAADPSQSPPAGAGGDSWGPTLSRNCRYVLFASTANNLMLRSESVV